MSAQVIDFPAASTLQKLTAGCMHACWLTRTGAPVAIESVGRLHRHLAAHRPGRVQTSRLVLQLQAATAWPEAARLSAVIAACQDGESAGEDADAAATRAHDITGVLGLVAMCHDALAPRYATMTDADISDAWIGLQLDVG